uniref:SCAN box domain-containing protein n=1 Tax=Erpetoichthys calabaricus TaxID=27687 RepID=A0A8C4RJZ1_ERPCA
VGVAMHCISACSITLSKKKSTYYTVQPGVKHVRLGGIYEVWGKVGRWLRPDVNSAQHMAELLTCESFINALPKKLAQQVCKQEVTSMDNLIEVVERHWAVCKSDGSQWSSRQSRQVRIPYSEPTRLPSEVSA